MIWIITIAAITLAFVSVYNGFLGSLPWISSMIGFPWTAYGISQACYYRKAQAENTKGGMVYDHHIPAQNDDTPSI